MKKVFIVSLAIISILLITNPEVQAAKRALLISIDEYKDKQINPLGGCVNDGKSMVKILKDHLGFNDGEIKFIKNEQATKSAILGAFESWLTEGTKAGDKIFIYFAGHGYYIRDTNGDEKDEEHPLDETLCPYDTDLSKLKDETVKGNMIIDDEIGERLKGLRGRVVVTIFDSCHSGTATRAIGVKQVAVRTLVITTGASRGQTRGDLNPPSHPRNTRVHSFSEEIDASDRYMVVLAAASPTQRAQELALNGTRHGALTYSIIKSFEKDGGKVSLWDVKDTFHAQRKEHPLPEKQDPQIEGNPGLAKRSLKDLFTASLASDLAHAAENTNKDMKLTLWANEKGQKRFKLHDTLRFHITCNSDGYLYIFDLIESSKEMYLVYPNQWSIMRESNRSNYIGRNEEILVPPTAVRGKPINFRFTADKRGKEKIIAIVTKRPWKDMDDVLGKTERPVKRMTETQQLQILDLLHQRQSERHLEYDPDEAISVPNDWAGTSLDIEIY